MALLRPSSSPSTRFRLVHRELDVEFDERRSRRILEVNDARVDDLDLFYRSELRGLPRQREVWCACAGGASILELTENRSDSLGSYAVHLKYWRRHSGRRKVTLERTFVVSRRVQSVALQALSCFLGNGKTWMAARA